MELIVPLYIIIFLKDNQSWFYILYYVFLGCLNSLKVVRFCENIFRLQGDILDDNDLNYKASGLRDGFRRSCDTIPHSFISTGGHSCGLVVPSVGRIRVDSSVVCFCDWSRDLVIRYNKIAFNLPEDGMAPRAISCVSSGPHAKGPSEALLSFLPIPLIILELRGQFYKSRSELLIPFW